MCLLLNFLADPDHQIDQRGQSDQNTHGGVDAIENCGGAGAGCPDKGGFGVLDSFDEWFHERL